MFMECIKVVICQLSWTKLYVKKHSNLQVKCTVYILYKRWVFLPYQWPKKKNVNKH